MSEDYTPSIGYLADCYWAFKMRDYDEHLTGKPYEVARLEYHTEFHRAIAAHDAELREQIAREIEARKPRASKLSEYVTGVRRGIYLAASIARGRTRASVELVERCERCGCDLRYPTAAHVVDCGTRKEQEQ